MLGLGTQSPSTPMCLLESIDIYPCVCVCVCLGYWGEGRREVGMAYVRRPCVRLPQYQCRLRL